MNAISSPLIQSAFAPSRRLSKLESLQSKSNKRCCDVSLCEQCFLLFKTTYLIFFNLMQKSNKLRLINPSLYYSVFIGLILLNQFPD